jgi:hypothetical protein
MKKNFVFFIIATSIVVSAGLSQVPGVSGMAGSLSANIKEDLKPVDSNQHEPIDQANASQSTVWEPQTVALILIGLIGLGLKRRQQS